VFGGFHIESAREVDALRAHKSISYGRTAFCFWILAVCSARLLSGPSTPASDPDLSERFEALANEILSDPNCLHPNNTGKILELKKLRNQVSAQHRDLLGLLVRGLDQCLKSEFEAAAKLLREPARSAYVRELAEMVVGDANMPSRIRRECQAQGRSPICRDCDNTGYICCGTCLGLGVMGCPNCGGYGRLWPSGRPRLRGNRPPTLDNSIDCPKCRGDGIIAGCDNRRCDGRGVWRCPCVDERQASIDSEDLDDCGKLISVASYLYAGGVDLYTSDAFECAPVLALSTSQEASDSDTEPDTSGNDPNM